MGPINLAKIKQVHQEMMQRSIAYEKLRAKFDWSEVLVKSPKHDYATWSDERIAHLEAQLTYERPKAPKPINSGPIGAEKTYACNGKLLTISQWAEESGVSKATLRQRLYKKWTIEEAIAGRRRKTQVANPSSIKNDKPKQTLKQMAHGAGIKASTLKGRLERGDTLDQALSRPVRARKKREQPVGLKVPVAFREQVMTLEQWAQHLGFSPFTLANRLRQGWAVERAFTVPPKGAMGRPRKDLTGEWSATFAHGTGTGGVPTLDTKPEQDFFS